MDASSCWCGCCRIHRLEEETTIRRLAFAVALIAAFTLATGKNKKLSAYSDKFWRFTAEIALNHTLNEYEKTIKRFEGYLPNDPDSITTQGKYGALPTFFVDEELGAIFPTPKKKPKSFSWSKITRLAVYSYVRQKLINIETKIFNSNQISEIRKIQETLRAITFEKRYLETWMPVLLSKTNEGTEEVSKENKKIARLYNPAFLKIHKIQGISNVIIPISTDITDKRFIQEAEGAVETYWNQSGWAKKKSLQFKIRWKIFPPNKTFSSGPIALENHLARFPIDAAILTTGALVHQVKGRALVLGPGKITPRTFAHEIGHILGYPDCYFRILQYRSFLGSYIEEWDNPFFPDELMCDDNVGYVGDMPW